MEWGDALAETFLAEAQSFGEDVFFKGGYYKAIVGTSDHIKALEMGGYLEEQSIEIIFPKASLVNLEHKPQVNEIIEARDKGFRIHKVETLEQEQSYSLTCELIPQYVPISKSSMMQGALYFQPKKVSHLTATVLQ